MNVKAVKAGMRKLVSLDEFNDEDETASLPVQTTLSGRADINWTQKMQGVRNQENCGSCWSFATMATVEGNWNIRKNLMVGWLSTQQLVDCDHSNNGCHGGWYSGSMNHLRTNLAMRDAVYPYTSGETGVQGACRYDANNATSVRTTGYLESNNANDLYNLLRDGPVAIAVNVNSWGSYSTGIFDEPCTPGVNHAVTLVGYGTEGGVGYWLIKNSWADYWGEKGYIRIKEDAYNSNSCSVGAYGFQPTF